MRPTRVIARAAGALALAAAALALVATPAQASAFRYWAYWQAPAGSLTWTFATQGPGTSIPADGDVEGWAYAVSTESGDPDDAPATAPEFAAICDDTPAEANSKRVALVIDTGSAAIAPAGQMPPSPTQTCVVAPTDATGYDILRSVVEVRIENGLVCGIDGYPTGECAPVLDDAEASALLSQAPDRATAAADPPAADMPDSAAAVEPSGDTGTPVATLAVGVLLIGGAAFWYLRGRRGR